MQRSGSDRDQMRVARYSRLGPVPPTRVVGMKTLRRQKVVEWIRRCLPLEIAGWAGELGSAAATYWLTGSFAAAVVVGTIGASVGTTPRLT